MRFSITVPDEYYTVIKDNLDQKGYTTINEFILDAIRHFFNLKSQQTSTVANSNKDITEIKPHQFGQTKTQSVNPPVISPSSPSGLSGKIKPCPYCGESFPIELGQKHYLENHEGAA